MNKAGYFFLILLLSFAIFQCEKKSIDPAVQPPQVIIISSVDDTSVIERGIDTVPEGNTIRLEWLPSEDEDVIQYEIYRRSENDINYQFIDFVEVPDTSYLDEDLETDIRYYYYVQALNDEDKRSDPSDTLSYKLLIKPDFLEPEGSIQDTRPLFRWQDDNQPDFYIIRVQDLISEEYVWLSVIQAEYGIQTQSVRFNADGQSELDSLLVGHAYRWRIDVRGPERNCGSESRWVPLNIQ